MRYMRPDGALVAAALLGLLSVAPFIVLDGRLILEPDLLASQIVYFYGVIQDGSWLALPPQPSGNVYFEGNIIIYAFATHVYEFIHNLFASPAPVYQTAKVTVGLVNGVAHMTATLIFFATIRRLSRHTGIAIIIAFLFAFSPQIIDIDLVRADRLMILGLVAVLHASISITSGVPKISDGVLLGAGMALLSSVKFTGVAFGVFPATAVLVALAFTGWKHEVLRRIGGVVVVSMMVALPAFAFLMVRHIMYPGAFIEFLKQGFADQVGAFDAFYASGPLLYYNVDLFLGYGYIFLGLILAAAIIVVIEAAFKRDPTAIWLIANLVIFSVVGAIIYKYSRGGYHLIPLYLFLFAIAARVLRAPSRVPRAITVAGMIALLIPVGTVALAFSDMASIAVKRSTSIAKTRFESRAWIEDRFQSGDRICMIRGSEWSNPHLDGSGFFVTTKMFDLPLERAAEAGNYMAPRLEQVRAACDAVVFDDLHKKVSIEYYRSHELGQRSREWEGLFDELEQEHPAEVFTADTPAYFVSRVDVHDLRSPRPPGVESSSPGRLSRRTAIDGSLSNDSLLFHRITIPLVPGRFVGSIDSAKYFNGKHLMLEGWAVDTFRQEPAIGIAIVAGSRVIGFDGTATVRRKDVAEYFGQDSLQLAGYATCLVYDSPSASERSLRIFAIGVDGVAGEIGPETVISPTAQPTDAPVPWVCRSSEGLAFW